MPRGDLSFPRCHLSARIGERRKKGMKRIAVVLSVIFVLAGAAWAQTDDSSWSVPSTKTVTNDNLEKFRIKRLSAEREYRKNYRNMGFPSPEEIDRLREESARDLADLAGRLRNERIERERIGVERMRAEAEIAAATTPPAAPETRTEYRTFYYGAPIYRGGTIYDNRYYKYRGLYRRWPYSGTGPFYTQPYRATPFGTYPQSTRPY